MGLIRPLTIALLGVALCMAGGIFDSASLYVPGVALVGIALVASGWVVMAATGAAIERRPGPHTVAEEESYPLRVEMRSGMVPPPGGELIEPLLGWPVPIAGRWSRRVRINVRFSRRGRRMLEPGRLLIRDPLRLFAREIVDSRRDEVLVLPRIEPVTAPGGGGAGAGNHGGLGIDPGVMGRRLDASMAELEIDGLRPYREGALSGRRRRCVCTLRSRAAARCCCPETAGRSRSDRTWVRGRPCTCVWRWSSPDRHHPPRRSARAGARSSGLRGPTC